MTTIPASRGLVLLNEQALRAVIAHIELMPWMWDQRKTRHCLAGWTCRLAGVHSVFGPQVFQTAQRLLGLTPSQAHDLFLWPGDHDAAHPTVAQLKAHVAAVTGMEFA